MVKGNKNQQQSSCSSFLLFRNSICYKVTSDLIANWLWLWKYITAGIQCPFANDISAHKYEVSPWNQRIEIFRSHNKQGYFCWIIDFFTDFVDSGQFHLGNYLHIECACFSFAPLIQSVLNKVKCDMILGPVYLTSYIFYRKEWVTKIRE